MFCEKCGKEIPEGLSECPVCTVLTEIVSENVSENVCVHCGATIAEDAEICVNCGCRVEKVVQPPVTSDTVAVLKKKKPSVKQILLLCGVAVAAVGVIIGAFFLWRHIRVQKIVNALEGETYRYYEYESYISTYTIKEMDFKDDMECDYHYYYSILDRGGDYTRTYSVKFRGKDVYIIMGVDEFELDFDRDGNIVALIDAENDEEYELQ